MKHKQPLPPPYAQPPVTQAPIPAPEVKPEVKLPMVESKVEPLKPAWQRQNCGGCHFLYEPTKACKRFPPQVLGTSAFPSSSVQPIVNPLTGWCGEWRAK